MLLVNTLSAQVEEVEDDGPFLNVNLNLQMGLPLGKFKENLGTTGLGMGALALLRIRKEPLTIKGGLELSGITYDAQSNLLELPVDGYYALFEMRTETSILLLHGVIRIEPKVDFFLKPYIDGMFGYKNLFNRTTLTDIEFDDEQLIDNTGSWAFSTGGAIGFKIPFNQHDPYTWTIDVRFAYLEGTATDYLVRREDDGTFYEEPLDAFEEKNSTTDMFLPQIGVTFAFGGKRYEEEYEEEYYDEDEEY